MRQVLHPVAMAALLSCASAALAGVDYIDIRSAGIYVNDGRVSVNPVNGRYAQIVEPETPFNVEMKAGCSGLNNRLKQTFVAFGNANMNGKVVEANPGMITTPISNRGNKEIDYIQAVIKVPTAQLSGSLKPVDICNTWLDQRLAQGASLHQLLAKDQIIAKPVTLSGVASCGKANSGQFEDEYRTDTMGHQLTVVCKAGSVPGVGGVQAQVPQPPQPPQPPGGFTKPLQVTAAALSATPAAVSGTCPAKVRFQGEVTGDAAGTVIYQVRFPGNANTQPQAWGGQLSFDKPGTRKTPVIEFNAQSGYPTGTAVMEIINPGNQKVYANFSVQCVAAQGQGAVQMAPKPGPKPGTTLQATPPAPPPLNLQATPQTPPPPPPLNLQAVPLSPSPTPPRDVQSR